MTQTTERVILIKGGGTKWYEQAIFIVNKETPAIHMPVDFVAEAEKIINAHMGTKAAAPAVYTSHMPKPYIQPSLHAPATPTGTRKKPKTSKFDFILNMVMVLACVAIVAVFVYGMML